MTKIRMTNSQMTNDHDVTPSSFGLRASLSFDIPCFVIPPDIRNFFSLEQSIHANRDEKYRAHECIALKERAIDSGQIEFLDFVFVNQRRCNQRHRPVIECAQIRGETKTNQRQERQKM